MLKIQEIRELIKLVDQSSIEEFIFEHEGSKIQMKKSSTETIAVSQPVAQTVAKEAPKPVAAEPVPVVQAEAKAAEPKEETKQETAADIANLHKITSPMVGTFYQAPSPDAEPFVKKGSVVTKDTVVCIIEAMKLFNEIEAEVNGEIVDILVEDGQLVEYGQPLFLVKTE
ncbi:acetyl-CoA carboxylase biotin carboxyl carrier protein [Bacillus methanolicus]|uniref:Biotin carboxyl carrier protein of acetyl-CoA carboxylase n=1 Tax=Bacillus methanolicus (strain MGA3 / ATCC 53907) TaxID=796606 RepID=I3EAC1_BACMM|nr:acetyl-CoA carboxylase biotin carboxyl carrier protein [Bacillus methanolicus]AIE60682.1 acetyl-CoA carboxylase biotin carboxyl carrier protein subunit [Bacillus methanolicus MGA3]EIJ83442.1 acetyl-CoA carboxylase biotin carboxyl carrier protein subunit [Bacillus methanolicus MGA3]